MLLFAFLLSLSALLSAVADEPPASRTSDSTFWKEQDRIRMDGEQIVMLFRGEVFLPDGSPASNIRVEAESGGPLRVSVAGNRFEFEVKKKPRVFESGVYILASSANGKLMASRAIYDFAARAMATRVIRIKLEQTRSAEIKVTHDGKPVPAANVIASTSFHHDLIGRTNDAGIYTATMPATSTLDRLFAWTDDHKVGGYQFSRRPIRDPKADEHTIELSPCRSQRIRVVDEEGNPVAGLPIEVNVSTLKDHNFVPRKSKDKFVTDNAGEAVDPWFPDWGPCNFYVNLVEDQTWYKTARERLEDGVIVARIGRSKTLQRHRITGQIKLPRNLKGGFKVRLGSFQHPQEGRYDPLDARSDVTGKFTADVMLGATYCICVDDAQWVSNFWTGVLYDPETGESQTPVLQLSKGERIEIEVTVGPNRHPMTNTTVSLTSRHGFTWLENGEQESGSLGRQWWVTTDENGQAITRSVAGELNADIHLPDWRPSQVVKVEPRATKVIKFHREAPGKRPVRGRVRLLKGLAADLTGARVQLFVIDRGTVGDAETKLDRDGRFSVDIAGTRIAAYVKTIDGKAAGSFIAEHPDQGVEFELLPTRDYRGQLLGGDDRPLARRWVRLTAQLIDEDASWQNTRFLQTRFNVDELEVVTDESGMFEFAGVPQLVKMRLAVQDSADENDADQNSPPRGQTIGTRILRPGEERPLDIVRIQAK